MKKIINGRAYNTETGILMASYQYGSNMSDWSFVSEELYITKKGSYFLYFEGGAMSKYAERVGKNETSCNSGIKVLSEEEAREFMEKYGDTDEYEKYFGEVEEG